MRMTAKQKTAQKYMSGYDVCVADMKRYGREYAQKYLRLIQRRKINEMWIEGYKTALIGEQPIYTYMDIID